MRSRSGPSGCCTLLGTPGDSALASSALRSTASSRSPPPIDCFLLPSCDSRVSSATKDCPQKALRKICQLRGWKGASGATAHLVYFIT